MLCYHVIDMSSGMVRILLSMIRISSDATPFFRNAAEFKHGGWELVVHPVVVTSRHNSSILSYIIIIMCTIIT